MQRCTLANLPIHSPALPIELRTTMPTHPQVMPASACSTALTPCSTLTQVLHGARPIHTSVDIQRLLLASFQAELDAEAPDVAAGAAKRPPSPTWEGDFSTPLAPRGRAEGRPAYQPPQPRNHVRRAAKRRRSTIAEGHRPKERTLNDHVQLSDPYPTNLDMASLGVANGGYSALREKGDDPTEKEGDPAEREYTLHELKEDLGFAVMEWDGR